MIVEQKLEQQIVAAISSAYPDVYYSPSWGVAQSGDVKGDEPVNTGAVVAITVSQMRTPTYCEGSNLEVEIPVEISCSVAAEADPTGELLFALYERTSGRVWDWVRFQTAEVETELTVFDGDSVAFAPGGVARDGGQPPVYGGAARMWTWSIAFTVKGILS